MTEKEKMLAHELYNFKSSELQPEFEAAHRHLRQFNQTDFDDSAASHAALKALIPDLPDSSRIKPPFLCDFGQTIHLGEHVFINMGCTFLDTGSITIGSHTKIGPNCQLYTPQHPFDYLERRDPVEHALPIVIGDDCWLCGGVTVCPGVTIGDRCIIGAGSVVVRDIPSDSMAAGNPAIVKHKLPSSANH